MKTQWTSHRDNSWFVWKFPKQNTGILYNSNTGKYELRELVEQKVEEKPKNLKIVDLTKYKLWIIALAGLLGISVAYNLFAHVIK